MGWLQHIRPQVEDSILKYSPVLKVPANREDAQQERRETYCLLAVLVFCLYRAFLIQRSIQNWNLPPAFCSGSFQSNTLFSWMWKPGQILGSKRETEGGQAGIAGGKCSYICNNDDDLAPVTVPQISCITLPHARPCLS